MCTKAKQLISLPFMNWIKSPRQHMILAFAFALALVSFTSCFTRIQAQPTKPVVSTVRFVPPPPPDRGTPTGRQRGGASRGQCPVVGKPLTALVPATQKTLGARQGSSPALGTLESVWGLTVAERPTLWFYVPYTLTPKLPIEFVLQDEQGNDVYQTSFTSSQTPPGIVRFRLPSTAAPLKVTTLAELRSANPQDATLRNDWVSLLQPVGLEAIAREPMSQCCTPEK